MKRKTRLMVIVLGNCILSVNCEVYTVEDGGDDAKNTKGSGKTKKISV